MQPGPPLVGEAQAPPPAPVKGPNRRLRLWLAMGAGILALFCLGGVGVAISLYDGATAIDRTTPDQVTSSFLRAYLVNRDDQGADLYRCKSGGDFAELEAFRNGITAVEKDHTVGIRVSWGSMAVATEDDKATVTTELTRTATDSARLSDTWQFGLADQDGWRVCSATEIS
jgi:hypothetical protein